MSGNQWVVVVGDPVEGFSYHGPFDTSEDACEYGDFHRGSNVDEYWVVPLRLFGTDDWVNPDNEEGCGKWGCKECYPDEEQT